MFLPFQDAGCKLNGSNNNLKKNQFLLKSCCHTANANKVKQNKTQQNFPLMLSNVFLRKPSEKHTRKLNSRVEYLLASFFIRTMFSSPFKKTLYVCLSVSRQISGNCDNNANQPRNSQRCLRPQRGQGLVLRQRNASWGRGSRLQGHCQTAIWKHSQYRCESKEPNLNKLTLCMHKNYWFALDAFPMIWKTALW